VSESNVAADTPLAPVYAQIKCGTCQRTLPLRLTNPGENAALWLCARCQVPFVAYAEEAALVHSAHLIQWDPRCFDVTGISDIRLELRQHVARLASRKPRSDPLGRRRSQRKRHSIVVPALKLGSGFAPVGDAFKIMVADLSREGIGLVHNERIDAEFIGLELAVDHFAPIQVIVRLVRQDALPGSPYLKIGGEFHLRLGSVPKYHV